MITSLDILWATFIAVGYTALAFVNKSRYGTRISPDGEYYAKMSKGEPVPLPYSFRPLIPMMCKTWDAWFASTYVHIGMIGYMYYLLAISLGCSQVQAASASVCLAMSKYHVRLMSFFPVLVDAPALAWGLATAVTFMNGYIGLGFACMVIASLVSEKSNLFAAIWSGSVLPITGYMITFFANLFVTEDTEPTGRDWLDEPFATAMKNLKEMWAKSPWQFVTPFGIGLLALQSTNVLVWAGIAAALLPIVRSMDYGRLASWAYPLMIIEAVKIFPTALLPVLPIVHQFISETEY